MYLCWERKGPDDGGITCMPEKELSAPNPFRKCKRQKKTCGFKLLRIIVRKIK